MLLLNRFNALKLSTLLFVSACVTGASAQLVHNQYPCAECAVFDNNGNDLKGFIKSNKRDLDIKGSKVNEYSGNNWGYLQIRSAAVPTINKYGEKKGDLNYAEVIMATFALYKSPDGAKATWWARECNSPNGPLTFRKVKDEGEPLEIENVRYETVTHELESKVFTIVEYYNDLYNERDYDMLLKNYMLMENGPVKDPTDYKAVIDYYNDFLKKFTYVDDPILGKRSFITFFAGSNNSKYIGYFNMVNSKLAGKLEAIDFQYESDKDTLVNKVFNKLKGGVVYVYGDETFGMEKPMVKYAREHNVKLKLPRTNTTKQFNDDK